MELRPISLLAPVCAGLILISNPGAAADCRGQAENECAASAACSWVAPYVRANGAKVQGYCRTRNSGQSANKPANKAVSDT